MGNNYFDNQEGMDHVFETDIHHFNEEESNFHLEIFVAYKVDFEVDFISMEV